MGLTKRSYINAQEWHQRPNPDEQCPICFVGPGSPIPETKEIAHRINVDGIASWKSIEWIGNNGMDRACRLLREQDANKIQK